MRIIHHGTGTEIHVPWPLLLLAVTFILAFAIGPDQTLKLSQEWYRWVRMITDPPPPPPPPADLALAVPPLVATGNPIQVTWSANNVTSCLPVSGDNRDSFPQQHSATSYFSPAGGATSSPITTRTVYTLDCTGLDGHTQSHLEATVNVEVSPPPKTGATKTYCADANELQGDILPLRKAPNRYVHNVIVEISPSTCGITLTGRERNESLSDPPFAIPWCEVNFETKTGWVNCDFLTLADPPTAEANGHHPLLYRDVSGA